MDKFLMYNEADMAAWRMGDPRTVDFVTWLMAERQRGLENVLTMTQAKRPDDALKASGGVAIIDQIIGALYRKDTAETVEEQPFVDPALRPLE